MIEERWNLDQTVAWFVWRNYETVKVFANSPPPYFGNYMLYDDDMPPSVPFRRAVDKKNNSQSSIPSERAEIKSPGPIQDDDHHWLTELHDCIRSGKITVWGKEKGNGKVELIPSMQFDKLYLAPSNPSIGNGGAFSISGRGTYWTELVFLVREVTSCFLPQTAKRANAYRTGAADRPTSWSYIEPEFHRRWETGERHSKIADWASTLHDWFTKAFYKLEDRALRPPNAGGFDLGNMVGEDRSRALFGIVAGHSIKWFLAVAAIHAVVITCIIYGFSSKAAHHIFRFREVSDLFWYICIISAVLLGYYFVLLSQGWQLVNFCMEKRQENIRRAREKADAASGNDQQNAHIKNEEMQKPPLAPPKKKEPSLLPSQREWPTASPEQLKADFLAGYRKGEEMAREQLRYRYMQRPRATEEGGQLLLQAISQYPEIQQTEEALQTFMVELDTAIAQTEAMGVVSVADDDASAKNITPTAMKIGPVKHEPRQLSPSEFKKLCDRQAKELVRNLRRNSLEGVDTN